MAAGADGQLDPEMLSRIIDLAARMSAEPGDVPLLGHIRDDATPSCVRDSDGVWHLIIRERGTVMVDRQSSDPEEFLSWVAVAIADAASYRLHTPGTPDYLRRIYAEQYRMLTVANPEWARAWLERTRKRLIDQGAHDDELGQLPDERAG
ncbi:Imm63 family immunity protein [Gordonia terrae]|uniref:Imm63 family immunity protein n=1 Tax=Gordonia hongkongensis TaxID=1701090 RepID=UPI0022B524D8|nr:Imm63 family immunity protein [Gordonia terrae]